MKNFPQGIFQSIEWLIKQVDRLKYQVVHTPNNGGGGGLTSVSTDGYTVQGNGTSGNPLTSYESMYSYGAGNISLQNLYTIHYIYDSGDQGITQSDVYFPSSPVLGQKITIINACGFIANLYPNGSLIQLLTYKTAVFVYIQPPTVAGQIDPPPTWHLLDIY